MNKEEHLIKKENEISIPDTQEDSEIIDEEEENRKFERNRRLYSNSNPNPDQLARLSLIRKLPLIHRLFRGFAKGSMRAVVMLWIRMTMGIGIMTTPFFISGFGLLGGFIALALGATLCFLSFGFIYETAIKTNKKDIAELVNYALPGFLYNTFRFTVFCDYMVVILAYSIVSYNMFEYILYFMGLFKEEWVKDKNKMIIDEYNPSVILIRIAYFGSLFMIQMPLFLKKDLSSLRNISLMYLGVMVAFLIYISIEAPFFKSHYANAGEWKVDMGVKPVTLNFIPNFFSLLLAFYNQPFCLSLRKELLNPTVNRLKKTTGLAVGWELLIYAFFGGLCYYSFGDYFTPQLIILRTPFDGKNIVSEVVFKAGIVIFFFLNVLGLAVFNPTIRNYLLQYIEIKNKALEYKLVSLGPFLLGCIIAILTPNIITVFWFFGLVFCNFNGFIIPTLMKIRIIKSEKQGLFKLVLCYILVGLYVSLGVIGVCVKIRSIFA